MSRKRGAFKSIGGGATTKTLALMRSVGGIKRPNRN